MNSKVEPHWWPEWLSYKAVQKEFEEAVEGIAGIGLQADAGWTMERVQKEIMPKRNSAYDAFRAKYRQH